MGVRGLCMFFLFVLSDGEFDGVAVEVVDVDTGGVALEVETVFAGAAGDDLFDRRHDNLTVIVDRNSYMERYCRQHEITFIYAEPGD